MQGAKALSTPLPTYYKLSQEDSLKSDEEQAEMSRIPYALAIGCLIYAIIATRPDITHAMGIVSRYMANPGKRHWEAVKGVMRYLKGTQDMCICYGQTNSAVHGYVDADYAGC